MKRIALCLDGTWNDNKAGFVQTNVAKLQPLIAKVDANGIRQISHYVPGIANTPGETAQFLKGAVGFGIGDRIRDAYEKLVADYEPGDEIYLFGFSRGAFEARSLGTLITLFGIAKSIANFPFEEAWSLYRTRARRRSEDALDEVRATAHYPVRIKCIGVWDTVGNIGNPFSSSGPIGRMFKFHDTRLSDSIDVGLQALSIDEIRGPFRPALWALPKDQALPETQHIEQVWFAGTHCNVGGGFRETGLSDIALRWMVERTAATTGLAFDTQELSHSTRPDPLAPQHMSATGSIFRWSRFVPFVRLVKQAIDGISPLRRALLGTWRTSKLRGGRVSVNESIHPSVLQRFGQKIIELNEDRSRMIVYRPRNLVPSMPEPQTPAVLAASDKPRRIKVFTVHGTFDHAAGWDNWDKDDNDCNKTENWLFINRLGHHLREHGIKLEDVDHTQYDWSGGNSHDERRVAAIGLKKLIETELTKTFAEHGKDYYDGVYIVGHSHGGTISRLAMNLWDKPHDYYDPVLDAHFDEFKHDDECPTCMRVRNGRVGPSTVPRPTGVITFGSPFVTFEKRPHGLLAAQIGAWVFRFLSLIPLAVLYIAYSYNFLPQLLSGLAPDWLELTIKLGLPLGAYWLVATYLPRLILGPMERGLGEGNALFAVSAVLQILKYAVSGVLAVYYVAYLVGWWTNVGGWTKAAQWLPFLGSPRLLDWVWWSVPFVAFWLLAVTLPGRLLGWVKHKVAALRDRLPTKYDPSEDRPTPYLSYLTFGDEARLHLIIFGTITWLVQTLALSAAFVLAVGIVLTIIVAVDAATQFLGSGSFLGKLGFSALSSDPVLQDRYIALMDWLTFYPSLVWSKLLGYRWDFTLGALATRHEVVWFIPGALVSAIALIFLLLMPVVLILLGIAYLVSLRLRGSGLVFGSEKFAWTLANNIAITAYANANTMMRRFFLAPDAWWRREYAHCHYYRSDRVLADVAAYMANWSSHHATSFLPVGRWVADSGRWLVVALFVLSIFAAAVPIARSYASAYASFLATYGDALPEIAAKALPRPAGPAVLCKEEPHKVVLELSDPQEILQCNLKQFAQLAEPKAKSRWESDVRAKFGAEWSNWSLARRGSPGSETYCTSYKYEVEAAPCRLREPADTAPAAPAPATQNGGRR